MENYREGAAMSLMVISSSIDYINGEAGLGFKVLLAVMVIDVLSGLLNAAHHKRIKSFIMSWGILKKGGIILSVVLGLLLDLLVNNGTPTFGVVMTWFAIGNEALSIIENLDGLGIAMPKIIMDKILDMSEVDGNDFPGNPFYEKEKYLNDTKDKEE